MANVTFIIGNGLDISLELNTTYRNFYQYVKKNKLHPKNCIYKAIQKENPIHWADFELGLGRFTKKIKIYLQKTRCQRGLLLNYFRPHRK